MVEHARSLGTEFAGHIRYDHFSIQNVQDISLELLGLIIPLILSIKTNNINILIVSDIFRKYQLYGNPPKRLVLWVVRTARCSKLC